MTFLMWVSPYLLSPNLDIIIKHFSLSVYDCLRSLQSWLKSRIHKPFHLFFMSTDSNLTNILHNHTYPQIYRDVQLKTNTETQIQNIQERRV